jgi:hypothetical protein
LKAIGASGYPFQTCHHHGTLTDMLRPKLLPDSVYAKKP